MISGDQEKKYQAAHEKTEIVLGQNDIVRREPGGGQCFAQGSRQQMKVDRYNESAENNAFGKSGRAEDKPDKTRYDKQNPVGSRYKF